MLKSPVFQSDEKANKGNLSFEVDSKNSELNEFDDYPEEDSKQFISMLTKCLGLLNKISDAVDVIKERCDHELINVVIKTAQDVVSCYSNTNGNSGTNLQSSVQLSNSFLDVCSLRSDSLQSSSQVSSSSLSSNLIVLSCSQLLGFHYNGYSHLHPIIADGNTISFRYPKNSIQLVEFFEMLLEQFQTVVSLHQSIVLPNLKRIESGLHAFSMVHDSDSLQLDSITGGSTNFYTSSELWLKIQILLQQLLDYYLGMTNISTAESIGPSIGSGLSTFLSPATLHFLFSSTSANVATGNVSGAGTSPAGGTALPTDYSSFFTKRRALAGAMNAMNAMTKNTMNAAVAAATSATSGQTNSSNQNQPGDNATSNTSTNAGSMSGPESTNVNLNMANNAAQSGDVTQSSHTSTGNFLSSVVSSTYSSRTAPVSYFKFDHSSQAISWNTFLAEQHQPSEKQKDSANNCDDKNTNDDCEKDSDKKDDDDIKELTNSAGATKSSSTPSPTSVSNKLFESLQSIASPSLDNLVLVYGTLIKFATKYQAIFVNEDHDGSSTIADEQQNSLHVYLLSAAEKFSSHINIQLDKMLESCTKSLENSVSISIPNLITNPPQDESINSQHNAAGGDLNKTFQQQQELHQDNLKQFPPLLDAAVLVDVSTRDLCALMQAMPEFSSEFLRYICNVLDRFKDACTQVYRNIVQPVTSLPGSNSTLDIHNAASNYGYDKRIISAYWTKDEDINRLLKSLPNWLTLQEYHCSMVNNPNVTSSSIVSNYSNRPRKVIHQLSSFDESPEEIRLRIMRETEILTSNLSKEITKYELLWQDGLLRQLAQLQESFEWMSSRCDDLVNVIIAIQQQQQANNIEPIGGNLSDVYIATLNQLTKDFAELAETCLLVLHLEVRVHCFYHLQVLDSSFFVNSAPPIDSIELLQGTRTMNRELYSDDPKIIPLMDDLRRMHDELQQASLKPIKMVYVFEGLGHLITTIFINSASQIRRVKPNGVKRVCRAIYDIQRRLTSITKSRELTLDYARQYFEMLLLSPEEILASIIERGQQFQHSEYVTIITLLHQSGLAHSTALGFDAHQSNMEMENNLKRLDEILNGITATL